MTTPFVYHHHEFEGYLGNGDGNRRFSASTDITAQPVTGHQDSVTRPVWLPHKVPAMAFGAMPLSALRVLVMR